MRKSDRVERVPRGLVRGDGSVKKQKKKKLLNPCFELDFLGASWEILEGRFADMCARFGSRGDGREILLLED
jgi:hypothetical protein